MRSAVLARRAVVLAACATLLLGGIAAADLAEGRSAAEPSPGAVVRLEVDQGGLSWTGPEIVEGGSVVVDTTAIEPGSLRSDLIDLHLGPVEGPGEVAASWRSPFGEDHVLLGSGASHPTSTVIQVGRRTTIEWAFSAPGAYDVGLTGSAPGHGGPTSTTGLLRFPRAEGTLDTSSATAERALTPAAAPALGAASVADDTATGRVVLSAGHVDMGPRIVDGAWRVQLKDDSVSPVAWRELSDVVLHAVEAAKTTVPSGSPFEFLGRAGDPIWVLPQAQQEGLLWPGWNTQHPSVTSKITGPVAWRILGVDGPGSFALFLTGSFGAPEVLFDADRPFPQLIDVQPNTHVHGSWAFGAPGIYRISLEMSATTQDGAVRDRQTLTFAVGSVDPQAGFGGAGGGGATTSTTVAGRSGTGSAGQRIDTSLGAPGRSSGGSAGDLADTGVRALLGEVGVGLALVAVGSSCVAVRRRLQKQD